MNTEQKLQKAKDFSVWLTKNKLNHLVHNKGWHVQVQREHHFYPSNNKYMNSESGIIKLYKDFKSKTSFEKFIQKNVVTEDN